MRFRLPSIAMLSLLSLISSVSASMVTNFSQTDNIIINSTSVISNAPGTPFGIWVASIIAAIILILISFFKFKDGEEGIVSVMAWFPSAFALYAAFNVDQITVAGVVASSGTYAVIEKHSLYHFDLIAYACLLPLLVLALINTARIWLNTKAMKQIAAVDEE